MTLPGNSWSLQEPVQTFFLAQYRRGPSFLLQCSGKKVKTVATEARPFCAGAPSSALVAPSFHPECSIVIPMATSAWEKNDKKVSILSNPTSSPTLVRVPAGQKKYALISAKFKGPGPGKYGRQPCTGIKNHDFTKYTEPAYTIRVKSSPKTIMVVESPGPCYYVDPSLSRLGIWRPASFFMQQRGKSANVVSTPSPNEYHVETVHPIDEPNAPAYTIGARTPYWLNSPTPGPNKYTLPGTLGPRLPNKIAAPYLSMTSCAPGRDYILRRGPGPAAYTIPEPDVYLQHQPSYTMSQRFIPSSKEHTPGPPDYSADQVTIHKPRAPRFSLGVRHSEYAHGTPTVCLIKE